MVLSRSVRAPSRAVSRVLAGALLAAALLGVAAPLAAQARRAAAAPPADTATAPAPPPARALLTSPDGADTLGALAPDARVEVVGREGEWARVRVEGWVRALPGEAPGPGTAQPISLRALRDDPERHRGRTVAWEVGFLALQRADSLRTDFRPGEHYLLARDPGGEPGFVYVAVPPALLPEVRRLVPMQRLRLVGRVRNGRSPLMGHPIIDLVEIRR